MTPLPAPMLPPGAFPTTHEQIAQLFAAMRYLAERVDGLTQESAELRARVEQLHARVEQHEQLQRESQAARGSKQRTARKGSKDR